MPCSGVYLMTRPTTAKIYTLSLHDALPIYRGGPGRPETGVADQGHPLARGVRPRCRRRSSGPRLSRSEEHTSELQSRENLVCRLLLEKKKTFTRAVTITIANACAISGLSDT